MQQLQLLDYQKLVLRVIFIGRDSKAYSLHHQANLLAEIIFSSSSEGPVIRH